MSELRFVDGDATRPQGPGFKIIPHCCNNLGAWGAGFVLALSRRWPRPQQEYQAWCARLGRDQFKDKLGATQLVPVEKDIAVANIIGQEGVRSSSDGTPPIRYAALEKGFGFIARYISQNLADQNASIHTPRIGCGLAGASWARVEPLLVKHFVDQDIPVTVYTYPGGSFNP